eukprot:ANDGO_00335.mRNA.1 Sphingosine-1-phosphate lyase
MSHNTVVDMVRDLVRDVDPKSFSLGAGSLAALYAVSKVLSSPEGLSVLNPLPALKDFGYFAVSRVPGGAALIAKENSKMIEKMNKAFSKAEASHAADDAEADGVTQSRTIVPRHTKIPEVGVDRNELLATMRKFIEYDCDWQHGRAFGFVYHGGEEHVDFMNKVYAAFSSTNPLHTSAFPSVQVMEAQVVRMTASMLHGPEDACGTMTSGGTESLMMALKTYRDYAAAIKGITRPEAVMPITAHPALAKGAHYFGIKIIYVPVNEISKKCDLSALEKAISKNTICIVGSAPQYPHGVVDPIPEMSEIARKRGIPMHVDGCLGGFIVPWIEKLGYPMPVFDFRNPGVTSMSADVHKYGYAAKGASVIVYRSPDLRNHQFFTITTWPGGLYGSPAAAGSRPGGLVATAWASMIAMGENGYLALAADIMKTTKALQDAVNSIDGLHVVAQPETCIFAIGSDTFDILAIGDGLSKKGWHLERQQLPASLHCTVTARQVDHYADFIRDLKEVVERYKSHPEEFREGLAAIYGASTKMPAKAVSSFIVQFMANLYKV